MFDAKFCFGTTHIPKGQLALHTRCAVRCPRLTVVLRAHSVRGKSSRDLETWNTLWKEINRLPVILTSVSWIRVNNICVLNTLFWKTMSIAVVYTVMKVSANAETWAYSPTLCSGYLACDIPHGHANREINHACSEALSRVQYFNSSESNTKRKNIRPGGNYSDTGWKCGEKYWDYG